MKITFALAAVLMLAGQSVASADLVLWSHPNSSDCDNSVWDVDVTTPTAVNEVPQAAGANTQMGNVG